jgi:hypothetical protein
MVTNHYGGIAKVTGDATIVVGHEAGSSVTHRGIS